MITIKLQLYEIVNSILDYVNDTINTNLCIDSNYIELYIKPKRESLYIKTKQGKKTVYREIEFFHLTDAYQDKLGISFKGGLHNTDKTIEMEFETLIEGSNDG